MERVEAYVDPCVPEGVRLALLIVRDCFGEIPEKACEILLRTGPQPLKDIVVRSGLTKKEASSAVMVLVQHSFAMALLQEEVVGPRKLLTQYVYKADAVRIIQTLQQPRCLMHVADTMGEWAEIVLRLLMENGRLTFDAIVQRLRAGHSHLTDAAATAHAARAVMLLMQENFVEQAPPCDLPLTFTPDPRKATKKKAKSKEDERDQLASAHELTLLQYQKMRFKIPATVLAAQVKAAMDAEDGDDDGVQSMDVDEPSADAAGPDAVVLLRVNFESFVKVFRHQQCVDMVVERDKDDAGLVVKAMLELSRHREVGPREPLSVWVEEAAIREKLNQGIAPAAVALHDVLLALLESDVSTVQTNEDGLWAVNTASVVSMIQFQAVSGHLKQRFGQRGLRIWRLLLMEHYLQADHIEKEAMINTRAVRQLVYAMLKAGYVSIQEIPKSAEHAPSKTIFTYGVTYFDTRTQLVSDLYKTAGNLLSRCQVELNREKTILDLASRKQLGDSVKLSSDQLKSVARLQVVIKALHVSLLKVADMMLLMSY